MPSEIEELVLRFAAERAQIDPEFLEEAVRGYLDELRDEVGEYGAQCVEAWCHHENIGRCTFCQRSFVKMSRAFQKRCVCCDKAIDKIAESGKFAWIRRHRRSHHYRSGAGSVVREVSEVIEALAAAEWALTLHKEMT